MNSQQKYYEENFVKEQVTEKVSKNVQDILDLVSLLSPLEIVELKKILRNYSVF